MNARAKCPYCGFVNIAPAECNSLEQHYAVRCGWNADEGGCGKLFAATIRFTPQVIVYRLEEAEKGECDEKV